MSSEALYRAIYEKYIGAIGLGNVRVDAALAQFEKDKRMGVSLIIPIHHVCDRYDQFVKIPAGIEPDLYLYPSEDLHVTVFDFVQASAPYRKDPSKAAFFKEIVGEIAGTIEPFLIQFKGVVFSDEAGMLQGFDEDRLVEIRRRIRMMLNRHGIKNDERYESQSAHITFCRFQREVKNIKAFLQFLQEYRSYDFGTETVAHWELVEHDWYNLKKKKMVIFDALLNREKTHEH